MIENQHRRVEHRESWAVPQSKLSANKELHNCVSNVVYRQTNKIGRFDLGRFDFGTFWLGTFWLGTFWLWDVLTWDVLTLGRFDLGRFDFGTFWLGTFWQITWDVLVLGCFDRIPTRAHDRVAIYGPNIKQSWAWCSLQIIYKGVEINSHSMLALSQQPSWVLGGTANVSDWLKFKSYMCDSSAIFPRRNKFFSNVLIYEDKQ